MDTSIGVIFIIIGVIFIVLGILALFSKYNLWLNTVEEIEYPVRRSINSATICKTAPTTPTSPKIQIFI